MEQEVYCISDFCKRYAISRRSFFREVKAQRLHIIKRGRRTVIARQDAERWLYDQRKQQRAIVELFDIHCGGLRDFLLNRS